MCVFEGFSVSLLLASCFLLLCVLLVLVTLLWMKRRVLCWKLRRLWWYRVLPLMTWLLRCLRL